jgi:hypothetical protein
MDRNFNKPKHLPTKQRRLYIRVAADKDNVDIVTAYDSANDRANDVNRINEWSADSSLHEEQHVFDQETLDAALEWGKTQKYTHYDAVNEFNHTAFGGIDSPVIWKAPEDVE